MIIKYKIFESKLPNPKYGDYVLCESISHIPNTPLSRWLQSNIGKVEGWYDALTSSNRFGDRRVIVKFDNLPEKLRHNHQAIINNLPDRENYRAFPLENVLYYSPNREDLEIIVQTRKYNL